MASLPTIEMVGPAGRRIVNESDRKMWEQKGYKVVGSEPAKTGDEGSGLGDMTIAKLKAYAEEKNIDLGDATKKADIVAAIEAAESETETGDEGSE